MSVVNRFNHNRYPPEVLSEHDDDGTMPDNLEEFSKHVIGHKIIKAEKVKTGRQRLYGRTNEVFRLTLDNGIEVELADTDDCCAYTSLTSFLLNPELVDHAILGVGTTDEYQTWHVFCDYGDILKLDVDWSCGNPFYYAYGFSINVNVVGEVIDGILHPSPQKEIEGK